MIAKKAPESQHYSGSGSLSSLSFRVAAAIAQKNGERDFIVEVIPNALAITTSKLKTYCPRILNTFHKIQKLSICFKVNKTSCLSPGKRTITRPGYPDRILDNRHNKLHGRQNSIGCVQKKIDSLHWYCRNYMKAQHTKQV